MGEERGNMAVTVASGDALSVRDFNVNEGLSSLFTVTLTAICDSADIDFEAVVGKEASFTLHGRGGSGKRTWSGLCNELHQVGVEEGGVSTYHLRIVPRLWIASQRRNHRMFQNMTELDIATKLLDEWGVKYEKKITAAYKTRKYRVQYGETDFAFFCRMLEEAGIAFYFQHDGEETICVVADAAQMNELRTPAIAFRDEPTVADKEHVTAIRVTRSMRPGKVTLRDHDYRRPASYNLAVSASSGGDEDQLESFHYTPGAFLFAAASGEDTPSADDKSKHRTDEGEGQTLAKKRLAAARAGASLAAFHTNVIDLSPGTVMSILDHPGRGVKDGQRLLVVESRMDGRRDEDWVVYCEVQPADEPYHPPLRATKPKVSGVESATVVGPPGEEIHTDEFGRVRVHFHWDRESKMDDNSSCWIHVSQPWGGSGFGGMNLPRVGQEVLVDFIGGDPDRPVIVGRVFTNLQKVPYKLPANKTQSGWKSNSTNGTGGYNELMFEDAAGKELVRVQAEKDLSKLVKNDEQVTIGHDRTKVVKNNEDVTIGKNLTKQVVENEREVTGLNRTVVVGVNRSTQIGAIDSTIVGQTHSMMVSPPGEGGGGDGTSIVTIHDRIELKTPGGASIVMEGNTIHLNAETIVVSASGTLSAVGTKHATFGSAGDVYLGSGGGEVTVKASKDLVLKGGPMVKVNP
jgi:type VI secretion system secreted protein VgrG